MYYITNETNGKYVVIKTTITGINNPFKVYGVFKINFISKHSDMLRLVPVRPYNKYMLSKTVYIDDISVNMCDSNLYNIDYEKVPVFGKRKLNEAISLSRKLNIQKFSGNPFNKSILADIGLLK